MDDIFSALSTGAKFKKNKNASGNNHATGMIPREQQAKGKGKVGKGRIDLLSAVDDDEEGVIEPTSEDEDEEVDVVSSSSSAHKSTKHTSSSFPSSSSSSSSSSAKCKGFSSEEEVNAFRNRLQIKVKGNNVPVPAATFADMKIIPHDLKTVLLNNIEQSAWKEPTPIQMQAIPAMLAGRDILASAPTGSGKTAAFLIPMLSKLGAPNKTGVRALLLAPTKELAQQIHREALRLCIGRRIKISLLKKMTSASSGNRKDALLGVDLLVATPLRLLSLLREDIVDLSHVETVVLDEADKLFELECAHDSTKKRKRPGQGSRGGESDDEEEAHEGEDDNSNAGSSSFLRQIDEILSKCPGTSSTGASLQRGLFSATLGPFVRELAASFLRDPIVVTIGTENTGASTIDQKLIFVGREEGKVLAIRQLIQQGIRPPVLLFLQSKDRAKDLYRELAFDGINVDVMHAERTSQQREDIIRRFRIGDIWVLICTDLMARGVDFKGVQMVINYDLPQSAVAYIHRIGRTGRANNRGTAVTFFTEEDMPRLRPIANVIKLSGCPVPDWMLNIRALKTKERKKLRLMAPRRREIDHDEMVRNRHDIKSGSKKGTKGKKN